MNALNNRISQIGVVPVIKLNHPERDAAALGRALCAGGVPVATPSVTRRSSAGLSARAACPWRRSPSAQPAPTRPSGS